MADIDSMLVQYGQDDLAALDRRLDTARIQAVILAVVAERRRTILGRMTWVLSVQAGTAALQIICLIVALSAG